MKNGLRTVRCDCGGVKCRTHIVCLSAACNGRDDLVRPIFAWRHTSRSLLVVRWQRATSYVLLKAPRHVSSFDRRWCADAWKGPWKNENDNFSVCGCRDADDGRRRGA